MHSSSKARTTLVCTAAAKREWHSSSDAGQHGSSEASYLGYTLGTLQIYFGYTSAILQIYFGYT